MRFPAKYRRRHTVSEFLFWVFGFAPLMEQSHISKQTNSDKIIHQEEQAHATSYASKIITTHLSQPFLMIQVE